MQVSTPVSAEQVRSLLITAQRGIGDARRSGINGDRSGTALIHPGEPFGLRLDNGRKGATARARDQRTRWLTRAGTGHSSDPLNSVIPVPSRNSGGTMTGSVA